MSCPICIETYTRELRAKVTCPYCPSHACRGCVQKYLLTSYDDPHCMECRKAWNRDFLDQHLTKTFRSGALRKHRAKVLMEREKAFLPAHQIFVEATKEIDKYVALDRITARKIADATIKRGEILIERQRVARFCRAATTIEEMDVNMKKMAEIHEKYGKIEAERMNYQFETETHNLRITDAQNILNGGTKVKETREFIARCPAEGCRGYLSSAYKCGTCGKFTCAECNSLKGDNRDAPHTCNEEAKASTALIRKETRPCPKCGVRIYKIDGCDQMFCTAENCHTAFSWNTGRVVTGVIHNPHYYEYLRNQNGGALPREAGDIPCGGLPHQWQFTRKVSVVTAIPHKEKNLIYAIFRCFADVADRLPDFPARPPATMNKDINIKYLMNQLSEDDWRKMLEQRETRFERKKEIGQILTMFTHVGAEYMRLLDNATDMWAAWKWNDDANKSIWKQCEDLRRYTNKSLYELGQRMMCAFPQISLEWNYIQPHKERTTDTIVSVNPYGVGTHAHTTYENSRVAYPPDLALKNYPPVAPTAPARPPAPQVAPVRPVGAPPVVVPAALAPPPQAQNRVITAEDFVADDAVVVE